MSLLISLLCPPMAVAMTGQAWQVGLNMLLTICFYVPGLIHALFITRHHQLERRHALVLASIDRYYH